MSRRLTEKEAEEIHKDFNKMKKALIEAKNRIRELEESNVYIQTTLTARQDESARLNKELSDELERIKSGDNVERTKEMFRNLFSKRKPLSVKNIPGKDKQTYLLNNLFPSEYVSSGEGYSKSELFAEQTEVEMSLIEAELGALREIYDNIPIGVVSLNGQIMALDIQPVLDNLQESRTNLSYMMSEKEFICFLTVHINEIKEIIHLFVSRCGQDVPVTILSSYEKGLLFYEGDREGESYIHSYVRNSDLQKRLMITSRVSNKLSKFKTISDLAYYHFFCPIENMIEGILITCKPVNNIVFIPIRDAKGPDYYNYYILDSFEQDKRIWKLDPHLIHTIRIFMEKFNQAGIQLFRRFYKDCFGHNDYILNFEEGLEKRGVERWKQMRVLYENIQVIGDENLIGEIMRKVIRIKTTLYPTEGMDLISTDKDSADAASDFKAMRQRWNSFLPPYNEEPEEWVYSVFDSCSARNSEKSYSIYCNRWKNFLAANKA